MGEEFKRYAEQRVNLEEHVWKDFKKILTTKTLKRKEHFLRQGEVCKQIGFIVKGYLRVYFLVDGEDITKDFNFENSFTGSYASFNMQEPSRFNVVAMEDVTLYTFTRDPLFTLYDKHPAIQKVGRLSIEHMYVRKELRENSFLLDTAEQRYEGLLKQYPGISNRVPLKYMASYLGITAETLSRIRGKS